MIQRLGLFAASKSRQLMKNLQARNLYVSNLYPYPNLYYKVVHYPSQVCYRETYKPAPWRAKWTKIAERTMTAFWAVWFYQLFDDPGAVMGHYHLPDPRKWTDEELGIPPLEAGSYKDWLMNKDL